MARKTKTATLVRDLDGFTGQAKLYHLSPPLATEPWDKDEKPKKYAYVVVSATVAMFSGPETYIFGANKDGDVVDWGELDGSFRGALDHEQALSNAGYEVK